MKISKIISKNNFGLTLIEMLVATTVFVIAVTLTSSLFVYVLKAQYKSNTMRLVQQEGRYAMESISREAKLAFGSSATSAMKVSPDNNTLTLTSFDSETNTSLIKIFRYNAVNRQLTEETIRNGTSTIGNLTSSKVRINQDETNPIFYCPVTYTPGINTPSSQQFVTIRFRIESFRGSGGPMESASMILKTTVSSRDYDYLN